MLLEKGPAGLRWAEGDDVPTAVKGLKAKRNRIERRQCIVRQPGNALTFKKEKGGTAAGSISLTKGGNSRREAECARSHRVQEVNSAAGNQEMGRSD